MYSVEINKNAAEFSRKLFDRRDNVEIICGNITENVIPDATVFFVFNPFGKNILCSFLDEVERKCKKGIRLYYLNAVFEDIFNERSDRWKCKKCVKLCPKHHVKVLLCEYEYTGKM